MSRFQPFFTRFMSIALILTGGLLLMNWMQNKNSNKDTLVLIIAVANLVVGLAVYGSALWKRREALKALAAQEEGDT